MQDHPYFTEVRLLAWIAALLLLIVLMLSGKTQVHDHLGAVLVMRTEDTGKAGSAYGL